MDVSEVRLESPVEYWRNRLAGAPALLELPLQRTRPALSGHRSASVRFALGKMLYRELTGLARRRDATVLVMFSTALFVLLHRLSSQTDIVMGTLVEDGALSETERSLWTSANALALRVQVDTDGSVARLLRQVNEVTLSAYEHRLPFETIVNAIETPQSVSHSPVFQVMLAWDDAQRGQREPPKPALDVEEASLTAIQLDLTVSLQETGEDIIGCFRYASDLFERSTIERWVRHYKRVLEEMLRDVEQPIGSLEILSPLEQKRLLEEFNATSIAYPQERLIHELFEEQVERTPDAAAVVYEGQWLTYEQLNERANQLARYLVSEGMRIGEYVPIVMPRCLQSLIAQIAVLKAGGAYVPLDPTMPAERQAFMIGDCDARRALCDGDVRVGCGPAGMRWVDCGAMGAAVEEFSAENLNLRMCEKPPAYVMYTSGSTGTPKGVIVPHCAVNRLVINNGYLEIVSGDCIAHCSNPAFDASTFEIWGALLNGARVLIIPYAVVLDASQFSRALAHGQVGILFLTTALFNQSVALISECLARLRCLLFGGERADPRVVAKFLEEAPRCRVLHVYGPTETTTFATWYEPKINDGDVNSIPIGKPISNTQIYILDDRQEPVAIGVVGEICIGGAGVARGYLNRPELTSERFIRDPFSADAQARLYRSGDLGRWHEDGTVEYLGRNDHQVKIRGFRIELGEIEAQLRRHPQVKDAVVLAREDEPGNKRLVAYIVGLDPAMLSVETLRAHLKAQLPDYMVPSAFVMLQSFPLTGNGKLDRRALPAPDLGAYESRGYEPPQGEIEEILAGIWQGLLRVERVGRQNNFFELGGHSLLEARLQAAVEEHFDLRTADFSVFQTPTIREMAVVIDGLRDRRPSLSDAPIPAAQIKAPDIPLGPRLPSERVPLNFAQQWLWQTAQLDHMPGGLSVYSALRLSGALQYDALFESHTALVQRHESIRTRIVRVGDSLEQLVGDFRDYELTTFDLSGLPLEEREKEAQRLAEELILQPYSTIGAPLFAAKLLKMDRLDHRLIMAMSHMISDGASLRVLTRDLCAVYAQLSRGQPISLPPMPVQFADYAVWQQKTHTMSAWDAKHGAYWAKRLAGASRTGLFAKEIFSRRRAGPKYAAHRFRLERTLSAGVADYSRRARTTIVLSLLTAFVTIVAGWSGRRDIVIPFSTLGRLHKDLDNVIGCFSAPLFLRLELSPEDTLLEVVERIHREYGLAHAHHDCGRIAARVPEPEFEWNPFFNWIPKETNIDTAATSPDQQESAARLRIEAYDLNLPLRDDVEWSPEILFALIEEPPDVSGVLEYRADKLPADVVERFACSFMRTVETLVVTPQARLSRVWEAMR